MIVVHTAFFQLLLVGGRGCRTGTFRSFTIFSAFSFSSSFSVEEIYFFFLSLFLFLLYMDVFALLVLKKLCSSDCLSVCSACFCDAFLTCFPLFSAVFFAIFRLFFAVF